MAQVDRKLLVRPAECNCGLADGQPHYHLHLLTVVSVAAFDLTVDRLERHLQVIAAEKQSDDS